MGWRNPKPLWARCARIEAICDLVVNRAAINQRLRTKPPCHSIFFPDARSRRAFVSAMLVCDTTGVVPLRRADCGSARCAWAAAGTVGVGGLCFIRCRPGVSTNRCSVTTGFASIKKAVCAAWQHVIMPFHVIPCHRHHAERHGGRTSKVSPSSLCRRRARGLRERVLRMGDWVDCR